MLSFEASFRIRLRHFLCIPDVDKGGFHYGQSLDTCAKVTMGLCLCRWTFAASVWPHGPISETSQGIQPPATPGPWSHVCYAGTLGTTRTNASRRRMGSLGSPNGAPPGPSTNAGPTSRTSARAAVSSPSSICCQPPARGTPSLANHSNRTGCRPTRHWEEPWRGCCWSHKAQSRGDRGQDRVSRPGGFSLNAF